MWPAELRSVQTHHSPQSTACRLCPAVIQDFCPLQTQLKTWPFVSGLILFVSCTLKMSLKRRFKLVTAFSSDYDVGQLCAKVKKKDRSKMVGILCAFRWTVSIVGCKGTSGPRQFSPRKKCSTLFHLAIIALGTRFASLNKFSCQVFFSAKLVYIAHMLSGSQSFLIIKIYFYYNVVAASDDDVIKGRQCACKRCYRISIKI